MSQLILQPFASPTSQLILQNFRCFTYVTPILQPFFRFSYVTDSSLTSPGEPPMQYVITQNNLIEK